MSNKFTLTAPSIGRTIEQPIVVEEEEETQDVVQLYNDEDEIDFDNLNLNVFPDLVPDEHPANDLVGNTKLIKLSKNDIVSLLNLIGTNIQQDNIDLIIYNCFHSSIDNKEEMFKIVNSCFNKTLLIY